MSLLYYVKAVAPPVPGLPLLGTEGLAALHVLRLAEEHLGKLHQVVNPHGSVGRHSVWSLLAGGGGGILGYMLGHWQVMHGHEESEWRAETVRHIHAVLCVGVGE